MLSNGGSRIDQDPSGFIRIQQDSTGFTRILWDGFTHLVRIFVHPKLAVFGLFVGFFGVELFGMLRIDVWDPAGSNPLSQWEGLAGTV